MSVPSSQLGFGREIDVSRQATKVIAVSCKLEWRIERFEKLMLLLKNGVNIVSKQFSSPRAPSVVWELHIFPNGKREEDFGSASFFLRQVGMQDRDVPLNTDFQIYALNMQNSPISICRDTKDFIHQQGRGKFQIPREKLAGVARTDGSVLIVCVAEFLHPDCSIGAKQHYEDPALENHDIQTELTLSKILRELWDTKLFADCEVEVDGESFMAHRCILANNSRVFRSMFSQKSMLEAQDGKVLINNTKLHCVRAMLEFMYSGFVVKADLEEMAPGILAVADKYEVDPLKKQCELFLVSRITDENVGELAILADTYSALLLRKKCLQLLAIRHKEVIRTVGWKELKRSRGSLVNDLLESVLAGPMDEDDEEDIIPKKRRF